MARPVGNRTTAKYSHLSAALMLSKCESGLSRGHNAASIQYALETGWPVEAAGFEPLHLEIRIC